jgi:hypothetical protein
MDNLLVLLSIVLVLFTIGLTCYLERKETEVGKLRTLLGVLVCFCILGCIILGIMIYLVITIYRSVTYLTYG